MNSYLLVTPNWNWDTTPLSVDTLKPPPCMPLEFAYLSSKLAGEIQILDAYVKNLTVDETLGLARSFAPSFVIMTTAPSILYWRCPPLTIEAPRLLADALKKNLDSRIVLIGPHGTYSPGWTQGVVPSDIVFRGAFENALPRLLDTLDNQVFLTNTSSEIVVEKAANLPSASFEHFDRLSSYRPHMWDVEDAEMAAAGDLTSGALLEATRGCPWSCSYCAKGPVRGEYDRRPLDKLEKEIEQLENLGFDYVFFIDETFNIPSNHFYDLLKILSKSSLKFGFQGRPDLLDKQICADLAASGCVYCELGIDVMSDHLSKSLARRQKIDAAMRGVDMAQRALPIVRFNRLNVSTLDYRTHLGMDQGSDGWPEPADPTYPYPGAVLGAQLMKLYGRETYDWDFGLRYSWWLRIEVELQRLALDLGDDTLAKFQRVFLEIDLEDATAIARIVEAYKSISEAKTDYNKHINNN